MIRSKPAYVGHAAGELQPSQAVPSKKAQELGIAAESLEHLSGWLLRQRRIKALRMHADLDG
jgi:hypothetical protein